MCTKSMHLTFLRCNASVRSCRWQVLQVSSKKSWGLLLENLTQQKMHDKFTLKKRKKEEAHGENRKLYN